MERFERFDENSGNVGLWCEEHDIQVYYVEDKDPYYMGFCVKCGYNLQDMPVRVIEEVFKK